jgi:Zn-dependent protease
MTPTRQGSFRLFRAFGIDVFIHWSWFLLALWAIDSRKGAYLSPIWNVYEYLGLFVLVLMHEFGHSLACRQVGGQADQIVLWPLGGVAYVSPPQRPGAMLWSIAAGPLVNVALVPVFFVITAAVKSSGLWATMPDTANWLRTLARINLGLLIFNILPVYPLDGGQILRSVLWFPLGRIRSLQVATIIGFAGVALLALLAFWERSIWMGVMTAFIFMNCKQGWQHATALRQAEAVKRRRDVACPECKTNPPEGPYWVCGKCDASFDIFAEQGVCPKCQAGYSAARCLDCGAWTPLREWTVTADQPVAPVRPYL